MTFKLHNFFRSSTSTRLRAALNLKGLSYDYVSYALRKGETRTPAFLAIIEWLDETYPQPPLLPADAVGRARVRALSYMIACEIHPLNNLRVLNHLTQTFGADEAAVNAWFTHWVHATFQPLETTLAQNSETGTFCHGEQPGLADLCLYAQVWNNKRFNIDMSAYPTISRIFTALDGIDAFKKAAPPNQPDATA
jgi:maleylpyruvate isomerase